MTGIVLTKTARSSVASPTAYSEALLGLRDATRRAARLNCEILRSGGRRGTAYTQSRKNDHVHSNLSSPALGVSQVFSICIASICSSFFMVMAFYVTPNRENSFEPREMNQQLPFVCSLRTNGATFLTLSQAAPFAPRHLVLRYFLTASLALHLFMIHIVSFSCPRCRLFPFVAYRPSGFVSPYSLPNMTSSSGHNLTRAPTAAG